jgi:hypothetical protein
MKNNGTQDKNNLHGIDDIANFHSFDGFDNSDSFDGFLRSQLLKDSQYLDDEDFTLALLKKLPSKKKISRLQESLILIIPILVISLLVFSQFSLAAIIIKTWVLLNIMNITTALQLSLLFFFISILGTTYWLAKQCRLV